MVAKKTNGAIGKIGEWVRWGLAVLVVPALLWILNIETDLARHDERIKTLKEEVTAAKAIKDLVDKNSRDFAQLKGTLDATDKSISRIESILLRSQ